MDSEAYATEQQSMCLSEDEPLLPINLQYLRTQGLFFPQIN